MILIFKLNRWIKNLLLEIKFTQIISNNSLLKLALFFLLNVFLPVRVDQDVSINLPVSFHTIVHYHTHMQPKQTYIHNIPTMATQYYH